MATESKSDPDLKRKFFNIEDIDFESSYREKCVPDEELTIDERARRIKYILVECKSSRRLSRMVEGTLYEPFGQAVTAFLS